MRARTAACAVLVVLAAVTGCSSDSNDDRGTDQPTTTAPAAAAADTYQACVDAVAAIPADDSGQVPSDPVPEACADLDEGDYLDAYMDGIAQSNQAGRDALQDLLDEASANAQP